MRKAIKDDRRPIAGSTSDRWRPRTLRPTREFIFAVMRYVSDRLRLRLAACADGIDGGGKRGRVGSRIEGGCVEDERLGLPLSSNPTSKSLRRQRPSGPRTRTGGRWSEPFLKAAVADHRSFPDGSRIARLAFSLFFLPAALTLEKKGGLRLTD